jgi:hypothetical protein
MKKHKIIIGEWVSVYVNQEVIVETDKDIENMTAEQLAQLLDYDDNTKILSVCKSDYDWTTEEHEDWDRHEDSGFTYVEQIKGDNNE